MRLPVEPERFGVVGLALTGRLDSNVFKGWPLESARIPGDPSPPLVAAGFLVFVARGDTDDNFLDALPAGFWERLRTHGDPRLRSVAVASDPLTGPDALTELAESDDAAVLCCVASHPNTPLRCWAAWQRSAASPKRQDVRWLET